jgi:hypothetical protein
VDRIVSSINAFGANQPTQPSRKERGLLIVIANDEKSLEVLEARRTALLQELDRVGEEIVQVRAELDKAKSLL